MLSEYLDAAMQAARFEIMEDGRHWGEIPPMPGVWASAATLEDCRRELRDVAEDWTLMAYWLHHSLPIISGIDPNLKLDTEPDPDETQGPDSEVAATGFPGTVPRHEAPLHGTR
jgi:predicted RNase H-like HicB family nuclease